MIFIIRGLPGSGKTTVGTQLAQHGSLVEANDYFYGDDGVYRFNPERLPDAHADCLARFNDRIGLWRRHRLFNQTHICVANTFVKIAHMQPYFDLCNKLELPFAVIECKGNFKSIHNVPQHTIDRMRREWEPYDPL